MSPYGGVHTSISFYWPNRLDEYEVDYEYGSLRFSKDTHWSDFLSEFLNQYGM